MAVFSLHKQKRNPVNNQSDGNHNIIVKMCIHPVIQRQPDHRGRNHRKHHLEPQPPCVPPLRRALAWREGIQLVEEQQDNRQNCAKLNDNLKQLIKFIRNLSFTNSFSRIMCVRRGNGQPFRNAFHNAKEYGLLKFLLPFYQKLLSCLYALFHRYIIIELPAGNNLFKRKLKKTASLKFYSNKAVSYRCDGI